MYKKEIITLSVFTPEYNAGCNFLEYVNIYTEWDLPQV